MLNEVARAPNPENADTNSGRGLLIVVSSPSGGGKGTLIDRVLQTVPDVSYSVSYFFVSKPAFEEMIQRGEFLEWANVYGYLYGTHRDQVDRERAAGKDIILEIDVQGAESIRGLITEAITIFILPPSFDKLRARLTARGTDSPIDLERRLRGAPAEVNQYRNFQYVILNDDINRASAQLASIVYAERAKRERQETMLKDALADFAASELQV